ncbi:undecaprenyl-diphosphatase [hydrocarbon metagenome]|uniref:Undecaprenyl-diphosphatase n=1 Tax=hydrocarbon metagenome TaxID=938273 RepID=A0A0W8FJ02_9ZZZZ
MDILTAVILGIMQGITEWLPISSEGQTMLFMLNHLGIEPHAALSYAIFLHVGTTLAVLVRFRREYLGILQNLQPDFRLTRILIGATLCTAVTAVPLYFLLKGALLGVDVAPVNLLIGMMLIATGILLKTSVWSGTKEIDQITDRDIAVLGFAQGFAIIPGISRSGITLAALLGGRVKQEAALAVSFLISVPAVIGAVVLDFEGIQQIQVQSAGILIVSSFAAGYLTMDLLLKYSRRISFWSFCVIVGVVLIAAGLISLLW